MPSARTPTPQTHPPPCPPLPCPQGTAVEKSINYLFEGYTESYVECTNVDVRSTKRESFMDIQLVVRVRGPLAGGAGSGNCRSGSPPTWDARLRLRHLRPHHPAAAVVHAHMPRPWAQLSALDHQPCVHTQRFPPPTPHQGCRDVYESFDKYCEVELLQGDNRYSTDSHGLQDACKGLKFEVLPPVLQLHLRRFDYDYQRDAMLKVTGCVLLYDYACVVTMTLGVRWERALKQSTLIVSEEGEG